MPLRYQEQNGKNTVFVDPTHVQNQLVVSHEVSKKPVGKQRVRAVSSQLTQAYYYAVDDCDDCASNNLLDDVRGLVRLNGANTQAKKDLWEAMKRNVDTMIAQGWLDGLRPELNLSTLVTVDDIIVVPDPKAKA